MMMYSFELLRDGELAPSRPDLLEQTQSRKRALEAGLRSSAPSHPSEDISTGNLAVRQVKHLKSYLTFKHIHFSQ